MNHSGPCYFSKGCNPRCSTKPSATCLNTATPLRIVLLEQAPQKEVWGPCKHPLVWIGFGVGALKGALQLRNLLWMILPYLQCSCSSPGKTSCSGFLRELEPWPLQRGTSWRKRTAPCLSREVVEGLSRNFQVQQRDQAPSPPSRVGDPRDEWMREQNHRAGCKTGHPWGGLEIGVT